MSAKVLVTGSSGYVAAWVTKLLLEAGYQVRGTVRSLANEDKVKPLRELCPQAKDNLELVVADLLKPESWANAVAGCDYVHHIASPFPARAPSDPQEVIRPAVDGTLNVLRACRDAKCVKRVVLTSSIAAIQEIKVLRENPGKVFDENDWLDTESKEGSYELSKVLAEKAAWDFVKPLQGDEAFELAVINPGLVMGPMLTNTDGTSATTMKYILGATMPMLPKMMINVADVRDVATAHLKAMTVPEAAGNRHLIVNRGFWFIEAADIIRAEFKDQGYYTPSYTAPNAMLKFASCFDGSIKMILGYLSLDFKYDNSRMRQVLGIEPTDIKKTLVDMGYSMIERGLIPKTNKYRGPPNIES